MKKQIAKIFTSEALREACREYLRARTVGGYGAVFPDDLADHVFDHYGIETDISELEEAKE
ncbi:hypothetical protein EMO92_08910 [Bifidobacterium reuteri]|uniref:Uncharacterized protein n=1 Tax=Bifidobacterium reuteri TaxID=983706 RepID=A0A5J5E5L7_9BIFI|nr:hypothetical protein [Bifidobacterium reuteri]KAA8824231.1 hypothetical protein EMO92_08910 [Bifidobacterium reuteri]